MLSYKYYILLLLSFIQLSCSDGSSTDNSTIYQQNKFVHELLQDRYLWYREVEADIDYADFESPEETLDFLMYHELDRFSYITDASKFESLFGEGQYLGYGLSYFIESDGSVRLKFVFNDSPSGRAGLQRGDKLLSINGQLVEQISVLEWQDVFGPAEEGYPIDLLVQKKNGSTVDIHMSKAVVNINTVLSYSVFDSASDTVGYLAFKSFLSTSNQELLEVFSLFSAEGVNKVILDLRYNGGGSVSVAQNLASYLIPTTSSTDLFASLEQNDKHQALNYSYYFKSMINELDLDQVVVITTGTTASASEMVINGLKPFVDVKTVGSKTFGKPVGMNPVEFDDKVILPITFAAFNQQGEGGYFDGLPVFCEAEDDVDYDFGNTLGPMLSEAIYVLANDECSDQQKLKNKMNDMSLESSYSLQAIIGAH